MHSYLHTQSTGARKEADGDAAASPITNFFGQNWLNLTNLVRFRQNWSKIGKINEIWANL